MTKVKGNKSTKGKGKAKAKTGKKVTVKALTKNVKVKQAKMKVDRSKQIENRGVPVNRNKMVETMIKNGPVLRVNVVKAIETKYPTTSHKMAMRTITRGKSEKYNEKYTKFTSLILEKTIEGEKYLAFTKKAFNDMVKATKAKAKSKKAIKA